MTKVTFRDRNDISPFTSLVDNLLTIGGEHLFVSSGYFMPNMAPWFIQRLSNGWVQSGKRITLIGGHWRIPVQSGISEEASSAQSQIWLNRFREFAQALREHDFGCDVQISARVAREYNWHAKIFLSYSLQSNSTRAAIIGSSNHTWSAIGREDLNTNWWHYEADCLLWADEAINSTPGLMEITKGVVALHGDNGKVSPQKELNNMHERIKELIERETTETV
jgi:hypothetical protein